MMEQIGLQYEILLDPRKAALLRKYFRQENDDIQGNERIHRRPIGRQPNAPGLFLTVVIAVVQAHGCVAGGRQRVACG